MHSLDNQNLRLYSWSTAFSSDQNAGAFDWSMFQSVEDDMKTDHISRRRSNDVSQHNTWCSGTSCGGINPYTLMARLGPGRIKGSDPLEDDARPGQSVRSPA
jgi:hypothetical protein